MWLSERWFEMEEYILLKSELWNLRNWLVKVTCLPAFLRLLRVAPLVTGKKAACDMSGR